MYEDETPTTKFFNLLEGVGWGEYPKLKSTETWVSKKIIMMCMFVKYVSILKIPVILYSCITVHRDLDTSSLPP